MTPETLANLVWEQLDALTLGSMRIKGDIARIYVREYSALYPFTALELWVTKTLGPKGVSISMQDVFGEYST